MPGCPTRNTANGSIPAFRDTFDQHLAARAAMEAELAERGLRNEEFAEEWEQRERRGAAGWMGRRPP